MSLEQFYSASTVPLQVSEKLDRHVKAAVCVVERTIETLSKKKADLSEVWTSWQLHVSQMKSAKKQWKKFKEQIKKVTRKLSICTAWRLIGVRQHPSRQSSWEQTVMKS